MIVFLLLMIVLILLFGAGMVKGWLANVAGYGCGGLLLIGIIIWVGSLFGEDGPQYVFWTIVGLLAVLAAFGAAANQRTP